MTSKAFCRLRSEVEHEIIAVRAHQGDAALDLALPLSGKLGEHHGFQYVAVRDVDRRFVLDVGWPRFRGQA